MEWAHISDERLRQLTNVQGTILARNQQSEAQQLLQETVCMTQIRAQRAHSHLGSK